MPKVLLLSLSPHGPARLRSDLAQQGVQVVGVLEAGHDLVRHVVRHAPDVLVVEALAPDDALFRCIKALADAAPVPVLLFAGPGGEAQTAHALASGVHAYVVDGYGAARLKALLELARVRWRHEQAVQQSIRELTQRLADRKAVERAKGILMQARQLSDDDAFQILRTVSMHANQRLGQVSEQIIQSSRLVEAVNRAGQLRMLSQRLVKLYLLQLAGVQLQDSRLRLAASVRRVEDNLEWLEKKFSPPATPEMLQPLLRHWADMRALLQQQSPHPELAPRLDALAERLLDEAEGLTERLRALGALPTLQVLNIAGRQRMLSQRYAKFVLLALLGGAEAKPEPEWAGLQQGARRLFEQGLASLRAAPLSTPDIRETLELADRTWHELLSVASRAGAATEVDTLRDCCDRLALASEGLLEAFEQLSVRYGRSLELLLG